MIKHHLYLHNLTPLRGLAAIWVAVFHFKGSILIFSYISWTRAMDKGYMMVDLFFIMSGFIIRHVYGESFSRQLTWANLKKFFVARAARIYPLHLFTLLCLVAVVWWQGDWNIVNDPAAIPTHLLLLHSFGIQKIYTWNRHSWSLSAEWAAYVVFPVLALFLGRKVRLAYLVLPLCIIMSYISLLYWLPPAGFGNRTRLLLHELDVTYDYGFLRGIAGFTLGMLLYKAYSNEKIRLFFSRDSAALTFILLTVFFMHEEVNDLLLIFSFTGLVFSFAANCACLHRVCSFRATQFIGKVSYSIYLIQGLVTMLFMACLQLPGIRQVVPPIYTASLLPASLYMLAYLTFLVGLSAITYYGLENPCRNFINRTFVAREKRRPKVSEVPVLLPPE